MVWSDACEEFAQKFATVEEKLERYMADHAAALPRDALERLTSTLQKIEIAKVEGVHGEEVSSAAQEIAGEILEELEAVENELHAVVRMQADTTLAT